jgi:hypothetical protein
MVKLTESEIRFAGIQAVEREVQNLVLGREDRYDADPDQGLDLHFRGCLGEICLAKATDRFWSGNLGNLKARDASTLQARATFRSDGGLTLHDIDKDDDVFVFVRLHRHRLEGVSGDIRGWIRGARGKQQKFWQPKGSLGKGWRFAAYVVPEDADELRSFPDEFLRPDLRQELLALDAASA